MDAEAKREKRRETNRRYYAKRKAEWAEKGAKSTAMHVSESALARSRRQMPSSMAVQAYGPFTPYRPFSECGATGLAMDSVSADAVEWASNGLPSDFDLVESFMGYPALAMLAQRPEYRRITETIANEMTRKGFELQSRGDDDKSEKIARIQSAIDKLGVLPALKEAAEHDGFFGRGHIFLDFGDDDQTELLTSVGDGRNQTSVNKVRKGSFQRVKTVEPVWCYPSTYNSNDPLAPDWYRPREWTVLGKTVHSSRLLTFIAREVPDLLKPAYAFGGLSMSQMAKPYVDNWLKTRQSVADIVSAFSVFVLSTNMAETLNAGQEGEDNFFRRIDLFNGTRDNRGLMVVDKDREAFQNVSAPLSGLDHLQAQAQEHMGAVSGIPLVKLTGISPSGLNASSEEEMECFYTWIGSQQETLFTPNLRKIIDFVQLSEFGEVDPDITFRWLPLKEMSEQQLAEIRRTDAETGRTLIESGAIKREEERQRVAADPDSPYTAIDISKPAGIPARERAEIATAKTNAIVAAADLVGPVVTMTELKKVGAETGMWDSITDEDIAEAEADAPDPFGSVASPAGTGPGESVEERGGSVPPGEEG